MESCLGCLSTKGCVKTVDMSVVHNFNLITSLNIKCTEDEPVAMCNECITSLDYCIQFRDKCIASDVTLKGMIRPKEKYLIVNDIKEEIEADFDDSFIKYEYIDDCDDANNVNHILVQDDENKKLQQPGIDADEDQVKKKPRRTPRNFKTKPTFNKNLELNVIETKESEAEVFYCGLCTNNYANKDYLLTHLEEVHKSNKVCLLCQLSCLSYPHLLAHRMDHVPAEQKGCLLCNNRHIATPLTMEFHYMTVHNLAEMNAKILCKICLKSYRSPRNLRHHLNDVHSEIKYKCDFCSKGFRRQQHLRIHLNTHTEERQHKCDKCDYKCNYIGSLKNHISRLHSKDKCVCKPCGRVFLTKELLEKHQSKCPAQKQNMCPVCGVTVRHVNRHMKSHSDTLKYKCEKCPSAYKSKSGYLIHLDKHDGVMRHQCKYCLKRFYSAPSLIKHTRIHTGEKPYVCEICSKAFPVKYYLKVHMKVHGIHLINKKNNVPEVANKSK